MPRDLDRRLRRLEGIHAPAMPMHALTVMARDAEHAAQQITEAVASGSHRPGWPVMIVTGLSAVGAHP